MSDIDPELLAWATLLRDAHKRSQSAWRPISTAPNNGTHVLVGTFPESPGIITRTVAHMFDGEWALSVNRNGDDSDFGVRCPTHWMPLPEPPPKEKSDA